MNSATSWLEAIAVILFCLAGVGRILDLARRIK
jgi:hypothetical protein